MACKGDQELLALAQIDPYETENVFKSSKPRAQSNVAIINNNITSTWVLSPCSREGNCSPKSEIVCREARTQALLTPAPHHTNSSICKGQCAS